FRALTPTRSEEWRVSREASTLDTHPSSPLGRWPQSLDGDGKCRFLEINRNFGGSDKPRKLSGPELCGHFCRHRYYIPNCFPKTDFPARTCLTRNTTLDVNEF